MKITLEKAAEKLLKEILKLKKGERVVVVTDRKNCQIFKAICSAIELKGCNLRKVRIKRKRQHSEPLSYLKKVFSESDVIIGITDKSISHCPEVRVARKKFGARVISMVEVDEKLFLKGIKANQKKIKAIGNKLARKLRKCKKVKILTKKRTNLVVNVIKNAISIDDGDSTKKGKLSNFPYEEVTMAPINIAKGIVAIDFSRIGIEPKDNAQIILKKGKIIDYNEKAKKFVEFLKRVDGEKALRIVELGFGINPEHRNLVGKIIHDEKIVGSVHVAFGGFGNKRKCKIHEDVILLKPTVFFDDKMVIKNGKII
ncbi:MAG: aminopeptidase [Candidatus Aenigmatarchaeota archaeon]